MTNAKTFPEWVEPETAAFMLGLLAIQKDSLNPYLSWRENQIALTEKVIQTTSEKSTSAVWLRAKKFNTKAAHIGQVHLFITIVDALKKETTTTRTDLIRWKKATLSHIEALHSLWMNRPPETMFLGFKYQFKSLLQPQDYETMSPEDRELYGNFLSKEQIVDPLGYIRKTIESVDLPRDAKTAGVNAERSSFLRKILMGMIQISGRQNFNSVSDLVTCFFGTLYARENVVRFSRNNQIKRRFVIESESKDKFLRRLLQSFGVVAKTPDEAINRIILRSNELS